MLIDLTSETAITLLTALRSRRRGLEQELGGAFSAPDTRARAEITAIDAAEDAIRRVIPDFSGRGLFPGERFRVVDEPGDEVYTVKDSTSWEIAAEARDGQKRRFVVGVGMDRIRRVFPGEPG